MASEYPVDNHCPVVDFDNESAEHAASWPSEFREMRAQCPRAWSNRHGGFWVATRFKDIVKIAQESASFASGKTVDPESGELTGGIGIPMSSLPALIPDETDNPAWRRYRDFINPHFAPKAIETRRAYARGVARTLIDRVIENGRFDIVQDFANPLPAISTMHLFGLDTSEWREFADPVHEFVFTSRGDPHFPEVIAGVERIGQRLTAGVAERRVNPRDDLLSYIANGEIDGQPMSDHEVQQFALNILFGGVDTTTGLTANVMRYLSQNPEKRRRLIEEPALIPRAREEFIRYFTPVHGLARNAMQDVVVDGWQFKKGERVLLAYASANRDEEIFEDAEEIKLDRFPNRHIGFGAGIHRCLGSFFARIMFESMLEEVLRRMPDFHVLEDESQPYPSIANINGWISMPATFTPGPKLGGGVNL